FKDPATAHGITDALRDAWALARALLQGSAGALRAYGEERDALSIPFFDVTDRIASLDWSLEEVRALHIDLHQVMRAEQEAVLGGQRKSAA
ncbi:MAG: NAD(P)/FAD-dependent oxidoreductase, partial [Pseudomonadota bacterium]